MTKRRLMQSTGLPARALAQIDTICRNLPADSGADFREVQKALGDSRYPSEFRSLTLEGLAERGLIFEISQGVYRVTAEGTAMLMRLRDNTPGKKTSASSRRANKAKADQHTEKAEAPQLVQPSTIRRMDGIYDKDECNFRHVRTGSLDFRDLPSRRGNMLVYRDGRQVPIDHAPTTTTRPRPSQADLQPVARPQPAANEHQVATANKPGRKPARRRAA